MSRSAPPFRRSTPLFMNEFFDTSVRTSDVAETQAWLQAQYGQVDVQADRGTFAEHAVGDTAFSMRRLIWQCRAEVVFEADRFYFATSTPGYAWTIGSETGEYSVEPGLVQPGHELIGRPDDTDLRLIAFDTGWLTDTARAIYGDDELAVRFAGTAPVSRRLRDHWLATVRWSLTQVPLLNEPLVRAHVRRTLATATLEAFPLVGDPRERRASAIEQERLAAAHHEIEAQQQQLALQAVSLERVRIARELHDVVAHHVSVMGIQASACRRALEKNPPKAVTALTAIEQGARTAVDELRRMLGALRATSPNEVEAPGAGIDRIAEIAERARAAGLKVDFGTYGEPAALPDSLSQAAYRIVQESVTNTLKHAQAGALDIRVRYLAGELELDVADDGRGGGPGGSGMGLIGMRERVAVHDGTLECGRRNSGGFRVRARLPYSTDVVGSAP